MNTYAALILSHGDHLRTRTKVKADNLREALEKVEEIRTTILAEDSRIVTIREV